MSRRMEDCEWREVVEEFPPVLNGHTVKLWQAAKKRPVLNFSPGPAKLPEAVLWRAQSELREYQHSGVSVLEMSHRSQEFKDILQGTERLFRQLLQIPSGYEVLFLQGGGTGQFAAVPLNLMGGAEGARAAADYAVTGSWSAKAAVEAGRYLHVNQLFPQPADKSYTRIPCASEWRQSDDAAYLYYCANETIHGIEFAGAPDVQRPGVPLVADMSSNILSRPIDVSKHGIIFAGTQKNIGAAGCTVVIVRSDIANAKPHQFCPSILSYKDQHANGSVYNTPPCFSIYLTKLVLEWVAEQGGVEEMDRRAHIKAHMIYQQIDDSLGFYSCPIASDCRSRMNVHFRVSGGADMEKKFLAGAEERHMLSLKGHRSVGGVRASLYNAVTIAEAQALADYMREFREQNELKAEQ